MRKINVAIICAADEEDTGCAAIVRSSPEFNIVTRASGLYAAGSWSAIARSDVVLLDEAVIDQDGTEAVRMVCDCYPMVRVMLVLERPDERRAMEVLAMGVTGIMVRSSLVSMLRKAIPVLCSGEAWVSRELVPGLRARNGRLTRQKLN